MFSRQRFRAVRKKNTQGIDLYSLLRPLEISKDAKEKKAQKKATSKADEDEFVAEEELFGDVDGFEDFEPVKSSQAFLCSDAPYSEESK